MDISYWSRIRSQRYTARQIHAGTYKPSPIGAKARRVATEIERERQRPIIDVPPPKTIGFDYWGSERYQLIQRVQALKAREIRDRGYLGPINNSARYVERNPVTGREVPKSDLIYAATHMAELMASGAIREDRWAFLWYH
jgi:hypothetical protein